MYDKWVNAGKPDLQEFLKANRPAQLAVMRSKPDEDGSELDKEEARDWQVRGHKGARAERQNSIREAPERLTCLAHPNMFSQISVPDTDDARAELTVADVHWSSRQMHRVPTRSASRSKPSVRQRTGPMKPRSRRPLRELTSRKPSSR